MSTMLSNFAIKPCTLNTWPQSHRDVSFAFTLHDPQVALLSVEMRSLREENERMRTMADVREPSEQLQSAIKDRDDAIAK